MKRTSSVLLLVGIWLVGLTCCGAEADKSTLDEALAEHVSLKVERDSLEGCLRSVETKVREKHPEFTLAILGRDLALEGITRNQVIRNLELTDLSAADALTELVLRANPNAAVKDPRSPKQQLVWIVGANPDKPERPAVLITTRAAAAKRGDRLPPGFFPLPEK